MDSRFATALACSLALHALLIAELRLGGSPAQHGDLNKPLLVYLQPDATQSPKVAEVKPSQRDITQANAQSRDHALLPEIKVEERYLLSSEVDVRAEPVQIPVLIYPEKAQQMKIDGLVRLQVYISKRGKIDAVNIVTANPPGIFEDAALEALLATSFTPAQKNGHAVKSEKLIEIKFDPYETINSP